MKKFLGILLTMVMVLSMTATVFAAPADLTGHEYKAYQIFKGTQTEEEEDATLAAVEWGDGVNGASLLAALKEDAVLKDAFKDCQTAADVANVLSGYGDKTPEAEAFAKVAYANKKGSGASIGDNLSAGYYLVVDETDFDENAENTVRNLALLQLTKKGTFEVENKTSIPEVEKKVMDANDSESDSTNEWQDSADYDLNDKVPFKITGKVAENYDDYKVYYFAFHDVQEAGLTFDPTSVVVKIGNATLVNGTDYTLNTECTDGCTFEVVFSDLKAIDKANDEFEVEGGTVITVEYKATLNENAVIGQEGNVNKVRLEYSNNPNDEQGGETGKTPWDNVIVFTYKVVVNKVDEDGNKLPGAGFALYKWNAKAEGEDKWELVEEFRDITDKTTFEFSRLDDGDYKLVETQVPAGYNKMNDVTFTVTASHDVEWTTEDREDILVSISGDKISGNITFTADKTEGSLTADVINQKGATLPETGGMGTTVFYILGAVLVLGAGVVLVTKKRMA